MNFGAACPECGTRLSAEPWSLGLCPHCSLLLALDQATDAPTELEDGADAAADGTVVQSFESLSLGPLSEGQVLGDRYRIRSVLGRGGMGEVWRAHDLKLRLDVALKSLRFELTTDDGAMEFLRQEVRAARKVVSPNVCRVFDLEELAGQELVSMEYVDGTTLRDILTERGPLELNEAREIASQFLAGLEGIHEAGLVHRDIKPENLMITRTGRVVVMDFGIAKRLRDEAAGAVAGTPAYMSPEQAHGQPVDARADLFSAGVVLAEMVEPAGCASPEERRRLLEDIHRAEPRIAATPWSQVIRKAVASERDERYASATALARALEEVTLRAAGDETAEPYPGLAAFGPENVDYFFGRELEVEALWKKLRRPQMLAVIGPSGAGKSSFLSAGLVPALPPSWGVVATKPGDRPFAALAGALDWVGPDEREPDEREGLEPSLSSEEPAALLESVSGWRAGHQHALLILDQFEELFTQNPPEVQAVFAELLGSLPLAAGVHVLLAMRDDFLLHCQAFESLAPIFSELTPLGAPTGAALRRAIVQPALKCGYRFEDESLAEEMLAEVEGERGSLPMVAFAAARLWEMRDRDSGLLTRQAYERIGGVGGALAQHAEQTLERIGRDDIPIIRELFRNLVTAQGTRAARDRDELLSVFEGESGGDRNVAQRVLDTLVDARLLTSYELPGPDGSASRTRIEIVHESLLVSWPRLVRWQTQDAASAQLRDQLRQAAQAWATRGRPNDLLWSGTSYKEFELWRQRYPGGLTTAEEEFARTMTAHAERRKRRRRTAIAAVILLLAVGLGIVGTFWRQATAARDRARTETRRAEANQLLALGRLEIETDPTGALAYALASLERADDPVTRLFALEALSRGPTAFVLDTAGAPSVDFSPDGRWLVSGHVDGSVKLWSASGGEPKLLGKEEQSVRRTQFGRRSDVVTSLDWKSDVARIRSVPDGELLGTISPGDQMDIRLVPSRSLLYTFRRQGPRLGLEAWPLDGGEPALRHELAAAFDGWYHQNQDWGLDLDPAGDSLAFVPLEQPVRRSEAGRQILLLPIEDLDAAPRSIGRHPEFVNRVRFHPDGEHLAAGYRSGDVRIWNLDGDVRNPQRTLHQPAGTVRSIAFDATGSKLAAGSDAGHVALWDLSGPPNADPTLLRLADTDWMKDVVFHPQGGWVVTGSGSGVRSWPIERPYPLAFEGHRDQVSAVAFLPDGEALASVSTDGTVRLWPLSATTGAGRRVFDTGVEFLFNVAAGSSGEQLLTCAWSGQVFVVPLDGRQPSELTGFRSHVQAVALGPSGKRAAAAGRGANRPEDAKIRVWDLESGKIQILDAGDGQSYFALRFTPDGRLVSAGVHGIRIWDLADASFQVLSDRPGLFDLTADGRLLLAGEQGENNEAVLFDLEAGTSRQLDSHGPAGFVAIDPAGRFAVTVWDQVKVGSLSGGAPHLIVGAEPFRWPTISPDGRWIAATDGSHSVRLWPTPDLSRPPLHTLPLERLLVELRTLTNLRVVSDSQAVTGWSYDLDRFPGWEEMPSW